MTTTSFVGPGTYVVFGIILFPIYTMVTAWFVGDPSDTRLAFLGLGYLISFIISLWSGLFVLTALIGLVFF